MSWVRLKEVRRERRSASQRELGAAEWGRKQSGEQLWAEPRHD